MAAFTAELATSIVLTLILPVVGFIINRENPLSFLTRHRVPRSVVVSLLISIVIGFLMIVGLTINISDLGATLAAPVPITQLLEDALGSAGALVFEWVP